MNDQGFSSDEVCRLAGVTYRQLDYWCRTGLVTPSIREAHTQGNYRRWSRSDVIVVAALAQFGQWWLRRLVAPELRRVAGLDDRWLVLAVADRRVWMFDRAGLDESLLGILAEVGDVTIICLRGLVEFDA